MAINQTLNGSNGDDNLFAFNVAEIELSSQAFNGNDNVQINADLSNSFIGLDGGNDTLNITSTTSVNPTIRLSTVRAGNGSDTIQISTRDGADLQIWGDYGNDDIRLSSVAGATDASFVRTTILGDNDTPDAAEGVDTVYIDDTVASFNQSFVNLNDNGNGIIAPVVDALLDFIAGDFTALDLVNIGLEGMLVQAGEIFESTFRGGSGSDWMLFDSSFTGVAGASPLDTSFINGNGGTDAIGVLRDSNNSTIRGGKDDDYITTIGGTNLRAVVNGNEGADSLVILDLLSQASSFFGGKGDDVITVASVEATNSVVSGDLGNDAINFLAVQSTDTTLLGGDGDDEIDDFSSAIRSLGNVLDGGTGDDVLRQAANIALPGILDFGSTFIGGTGADVMTGDSNTQLLDRKQANGIPGEVTDIEGASSDLFRFSFGDSVINSAGVGFDEITDFDSDASFYLRSDAPDGGPVEPFFGPAPGTSAFAIQADTVGGLDVLERDVIDLTDRNISFGLSGVLSGGAAAYVVNNRGLVVSGIDNLTEFVEAGGQQSVGAAILWNQFPEPDIFPEPFNQEVFRASWLFISDGTAGVSDGDLLVKLTNVGEFSATGGLVINGGNITNIIV